MRVRAASGGGSGLNTALVACVIAAVAWWVLAAQYLPGQVMQSDMAAAKSAVAKGLRTGSSIAATLRFLESSSLRGFTATHDFSNVTPDTAMVQVPAPDDAQRTGQLCRSERYSQGATLFAAALGTIHSLGMSTNKRLEICFYYDHQGALQRVAVYEHSI